MISFSIESVVFRLCNPLRNFSGIHTSKAGPMWAPFTALKYKELGLIISAREVDLPISLISKTNRLYK